MKCLFPASSILCGDVITVSIEVEEVEEEPGNKRRTALKRREGGGGSKVVGEDDVFIVPDV